MSGIRFDRHFVFLLIACVGVIAGWRLSQAFGFSKLPVIPKLALYGALHATTLVLAIGGPSLLRLRSVFVLIASGFSVLALYAGIQIARWMGLFNSQHAFVAAFAVTSAVGAVLYGLLIRWTWLRQFSVLGILTIAASCVVTTLVTAHMAAGSPWLAEGLSVVWWLTFSSGLYLLARQRWRNGLQDQSAQASER